MTKLLVSVRDASEAAVAVQGGVDLIDVKEPRRGSLGAADLATIEAIARTLAGRLPLSVALGEVDADPLLLPESLAGRVSFAKVGLAGSGRRGDWLERWRRVIATIPAGITPVAVCYADWQTAQTPPPAAILQGGIALGCGGLLLDTFDKTRGAIFQHLRQDDLLALLHTARRHALTTVVAGGLSYDLLPQAISLEPDYVAVRGAACAGQRTATLDARRVAQLAHLIHGAETSAGA